MTSKGTLPNNLASFLRCSENKTELLRSLLELVISQMTGYKLFVVTYDGAVLVNQKINTYNLMPCTIEEADDRMFVRASDAAKAFSKLLIKTVDSDIAVIAVSAFHKVVGLTELWIEFRVGKYLKYIPIHELASKFGKSHVTSLPIFSCYQ